MYKDDIAAKRIPPQFIRDGVEMTFGDWENIRCAERHAHAPYKATPEQIQAARKEAADRMIETILAGYRLRRTKATKSSAQRAKEEDDAIRSRYTY